MVLAAMLLRFPGAQLGQQLLLQRDGLLHGGQDGGPIQLLPRSGEDGGSGVELSEEGYRPVQLVLGQSTGAGKEDGSSGFHLIFIELTKVLQVGPHLGGVDHSDKAVELQFGNLGGGIFHRGHHVGQLAHTGGFDEDAVGVELCLHVLQGLGEVTYQGAADASGGHLGDLHAGVFQEAAVNADLAKLIFNEHQLLAGVGPVQQFLDQGGFPGPQKAGDDIDLGHSG